MEIKHAPAAGRIDGASDGSIAPRDDGREDARTLDLRSTFVPEALRGRGIAGQIVRHALDYARSEGLKVIPTCSYVASTIRRNPEFADLVAE